MLVQWGRRGGGPKLLYTLVQQLRELNVNVSISIAQKNSTSIEGIGLESSQINFMDIIKGQDLLSPMKYLKCRGEFKKFVREVDPDLIVFVMPHPWDSRIKIDKPIIRILHDFKRHPGDGIWPLNSSIRKRVHSECKVVSLSSYVTELLERNNVKTIASYHPVFQFESKDTKRAREIDVLVIGRMRFYKGTDRLLYVWPLVLDRFPEAKLHIAGEGRIDPRLRALQNLTIENHWLTETRISSLLHVSKTVLFPYREASQSGLLPAASAAGARVIATPVGGLIEQVKIFGGLVSDNESDEAIAAAIITSLTESINIDTTSLGHYDTHLSKTLLRVALNSEGKQ